MIFASLEIERDLPTWAEFVPMVTTWLRDAGSVAALGLVIYWLTRLMPQQDKGWSYAAGSGPGQRWTGTGPVFKLLSAASLCAYLTFLGLLAIERGMVPETKLVEGDTRAIVIYHYTPAQNTALVIAGTLALIAALMPMTAGLYNRLAWRRIYAIARLSVKEAIRSRIVLVFAVMIAVYLFADWFIPPRPEDMIRSYVGILYFATAVLFLVVAALLGSFSIPNDVTKQTIHTIVTKPVEKYEIVLGRFLGYGFLLTVFLIVLTSINLLFVMRGVTPEARAESYKARVPVFSDQLVFHGTLDPRKGENVGREWTYRSYIRGRIPGSAEATQYAIWKFQSVPTWLADRQEPIPVEFTFDIFRTTKGEEDKGVICSLIFADGRLPVDQIETALKNQRTETITAETSIDAEWEQKLQKAATQAERDEIEAKRQEARRQARNEIIQKYGLYEVGGVMVTDYHTQSVSVPPEFFKRINEVQNEISQSADPEGVKPVPMQVLLRVNNDMASRYQRVGVARRDLYLLSDELPFWQNFIKGSIGLWCNTMLILAIAVACSTYLSGIISLLATTFFLGLGLLVEFLQALATGAAAGGGPIESANRVLNRVSAATQLEETTATAIATGADEAYRWVLSYVLKMIPDSHRYNLTEYVASGFDIPWGQVLFLDNVLPTLGYLIPWGIVAYYGITSREIANPM